MKSIKISIILMGLLSFTACDYLDKEQDTELTLPMVFETRSRVESWLANVYSSVPESTWGYLRASEGWDVMGDEFSPSYRWYNYGWNPILYTAGYWTPTSGWSADYWVQLPRRIRSAYIFIQNVKPLPEQGISVQDVEYMKAECRFLVAYYYYLLVNTYGAIPFQPNYTTPTDFNLSDLMVEQTPYDEVVDWIDKELTAVSKILPATYTETNKYGRATSIMCLAVRARMLLFAASDLVNGNSDYAGYVNKSGVPIFSKDKDLAKWVKASTACKELIVAAEAAGHELYKEYTGGEIDPFSSCQNLFLTDYYAGNKEILFARPSATNWDYDKHATPASAGGNGGLGVTQRLVDAFFMKNGLPRGATGSGYVEAGFSTGNDVRNTKWDGCKSGGIITEVGTYNMYCNREPRFYTAVYYNKAYYPNSGTEMNFFLGQKDNANPEGHWDAPQNGYLVRKKTSPKTIVNANYYPYRPNIIFRLGEAYLNYAEALNESNPGNPEILEYLNLIRERAGVRKYTIGSTDTEYIHVDNDPVSIREIIRHERNVELCCEGTRYDDLRRWKKAEELLDGSFDGMNFMGKNATDFYKRVPIEPARVYRKQFYWFPIHQDHIDKNVNLVQTPYWN